MNILQLRRFFTRYGVEHNYMERIRYITELRIGNLSLRYECR